ncbi:DUF3106 domain-containing protein [Ectothiorhodospira shaposhnikovii]|uniref:DUF3106 domain-containing protein n=1 Tax=Ectothiorhodospira shaposhnikovii TaxID=1054 RepID=UPI001EE85DB5|nr:DUF3106 domain-containing protein [Ectothiorhodospira shaposhnikovii]MCG5513681.1 DUF3106 domain-containing protein [Ectothiorhodospira shaposhnikovii]
MKSFQLPFSRRVTGAAILVGAVALSLSMGAMAAPGGLGAMDRDTPRQVCRDLTDDAWAACREAMRTTRGERRAQCPVAEDRPMERSWRQDRRGDPMWGEAKHPRMSPEDRQAFLAWREEQRAAWEAMSAEEREAFRAERAERFGPRGMDEEKRAAMQEQIRERRQAWEAMSPEERQSMRENMRSMREQMRSLDPQERLELRERLRDMTPDERRAWFEQQRG